MTTERVASADRGASARLRELLTRATTAPAYEADAADLEEVRVAGVDLPVRAMVALFVATAAIVLDETHRLVDPAVGGLLGSTAVGDPALQTSLDRVVLFGLLPLAVVIAAFRDAPARYGLTLGDWRWGAGLLVAGLAIMTPIIAWFATFPDFVAYYRGASAPVGRLALDNLLDVGSAEFLLRGFLMFVLLRRIGPIAIVVVQVPFVLTHIGKPEIELWSTFLGGSIFAWLDWRTRSVLWSALGHAYVLTLMVVLAGGLRA
jgi:membrane protease YdiL (CAAX protease family)